MERQKKRKAKRFMAGWKIVLLDILALGLALVVFALFHHVIPRDGGGPIRTIVSADALPLARPVTASAADATESISFSRAAIGDFSASFPAGRATEYDNIVLDIRTETREFARGPAVCYIAEIWIKNIFQLRSAFAENRYGTGIHESIEKMAADNGAVLAITGDYFGAREGGVVIRNGELYRETPLEDVCVLYQDGVMETYTRAQFDLDRAEARGAYQAWSFGPQLLIDGLPQTEFDTGIARHNPRTAIGYYAPGHYAFIVVDGRQDGYSKGMTLAELSQLTYDLGCEAAYNLDGGQTSAMMFQGEYVNRPYNGGREISDIIYIGE